MMPITPEVLDELLKDYKSPDDMFGDDGLLQQLTKAVVERALQGEMTHHLGYEKHDPAGANSGNSRNGKSSKTIKGKRGQMQIDVPRDRASEFAPQLIKKGQTRFDGFDDKIISMYARGMTCREIQAHLQEIYGVEVSPEMISTVTDSVIDEVRAWQSRPLDPVYPILYLDALQVKVKDQGRVSNKAIYLAIGVNLQGTKEVLGLWASENEGAKFWLSIITELKNRGVKDIFIACVDGLKGFPEAIETIYPKTQVQLCLVHLMRFSLAYVSFKDRKAVAADLKMIYRAATAAEAEPHLAAFAETWDSRYPSISKSWRTNWARVIPMFGFPDDIRRAVYMTNAIESLNMSLRKVIKTRASFPNDDAAFKLLYLALRNIAKSGRCPSHTGVRRCRLLRSSLKGACRRWMDNRLHNSSDTLPPEDGSDDFLSLHTRLPLYLFQASRVAAVAECFLKADRSIRHWLKREHWPAGLDLVSCIERVA